MILAQSQSAIQGQADRNVLQVVLFARTLPLLGPRLVAHVGGAGEALLITAGAFLDMQQGLLQLIFAHGMGEVQPLRERPVELGVGEGAHLLVEVGHLPLPESGYKVVHHQGYELAFLGLTVSHLRLLGSLSRPSLQRIFGAVLRGDA